MCPSTRQLSWCLPPPPPVVTEQPRQTACEQQIFVAHSGGGGRWASESTGQWGRVLGGGLPPSHVRGTRPVMSAECLPQGFPKAPPPGAVTFWG